MLYPFSRVLTLVFVFPFRIPALFFLGFWFLYQLVEANFGLFSATANGGGVAFFAPVGSSSSDSSSRSSSTTPAGSARPTTRQLCELPHERRDPHLLRRLRRVDPRDRRRRRPRLDSARGCPERRGAGSRSPSRTRCSSRASSTSSTSTQKPHGSARRRARDMQSGPASRRRRRAVSAHRPWQALVTYADVIEAELIVLRSRALLRARRADQGKHLAPGRRARRTAGADRPASACPSDSRRRLSRESMRPPSPARPVCRAHGTNL